MNDKPVLELEPETKRYIEMFRSNNTDIDVDKFLNEKINEAIIDYLRQKLGGVFANPLPKKEGEKSLTETLFEFRRSGEI